MVSLALFPPFLFSPSSTFYHTEYFCIHLGIISNLLDETDDGSSVLALQGLAADNDDGVLGAVQGLGKGMGARCQLLQDIRGVSQMLK